MFITQREQSGSTEASCPSATRASDEAAFARARCSQRTRARVSRMPRQQQGLPPELDSVPPADHRMVHSRGSVSSARGVLLPSSTRGPAGSLTPPTSASRWRGSRRAHVSSCRTAKWVSYLFPDMICCILLTLMSCLFVLLLLVVLSSRIAEK